MYNCLKELNIPCTLILDSAVGYIMEKVDMVMVGAECVVESGGIINKVTNQYFINFFFFNYANIYLFTNQV